MCFPKSSIALNQRWIWTSWGRGTSVGTVALTGGREDCQQQKFDHVFGSSGGFDEFWLPLPPPFIPQLGLRCKSVALSPFPPSLPHEPSVHLWPVTHSCYQWQQRTSPTLTRPKGKNALTRERRGRALRVVVLVVFPFFTSRSCVLRLQSIWIWWETGNRNQYWLAPLRAVFPWYRELCEVILKQMVCYLFFPNQIFQIVSQPIVCLSTKLFLVLMWKTLEKCWHETQEDLDLKNKQTNKQIFQLFSGVFSAHVCNEKTKQKHTTTTQTSE